MTYKLNPLRPRTKLVDQPAFRNLLDAEQKEMWVDSDLPASTDMLMGGPRGEPGTDNPDALDLLEQHTTLTLDGQRTYPSSPEVIAVHSERVTSTTDPVDMETVDGRANATTTAAPVDDVAAAVADDDAKDSMNTLLLLAVLGIVAWTAFGGGE